MSLDTSFHVIYGYKIKSNKLEDDVEKYTSKEKGWILPNDLAINDFFEQLENSDKLQLVTDPMGNGYEFFGIPLIYTYDDYGEPWHYQYTLNDISKLCSDEQLDTLIQEKIPFIIGNEYDVAGLLYGELPQLYIIKRVW